MNRRIKVLEYRLAEGRKHYEAQALELKIALERQEKDQKYIEKLERDVNDLTALCDYRAKAIKEMRK